MTLEKIPMILDREITSAQEDRFGHRHYAQILTEMIESSMKPPYTIGLLGKWGVGKSSIKSMYLDELRDQTSKDSMGRTRAEKILPIIFNAWRFGGENIKRALLRQVFIALGGDPKRLRDELFSQLQSVGSQKRQWRQVWRDVFEVWVWNIVQILIVVLVGIVLPSIVLVKCLGISGQLVKWLTIAALGSSNVLIVRYIFDPKNFLIKRSSNITKIHQPSTSAEEYEELLVEQLAKFVSSKDGEKCENIVVFVDDLDRLAADEMVSGIDAVRTFMEIPLPRTADGVGIVFVISCDEDRVAEALADRQRQRATPELPGTIFTRSDAHRYLDRIFQFKLEIPSFPRRDMRNYTLELLRHRMPELAIDLQSRQCDLENLVSYMIHVDVQSPRNAIQILNTFGHSWWVAVQREREGDGTEVPGGLQEGAVTHHPITLAILSVLKVDFPDFYGELLSNSKIISLFTEEFILGSDTPNKTLNKYRNKEGALKEDYYPLRKFIASVQGVLWPTNLQPLLLLTQDPVSRHYGDKAVPLYEAFVSGDSKAFLEALGRDKDSKTFSVHEEGLLKDIAEDVFSTETTMRQDNAASVLVDLLHRYTNDQANSLLRHAIHRLTRSPHMLSRLGIRKIRNTLEHARHEERRVIAGVLHEALIKSDSDIDFRLPNGQIPTIEQAADIVRETVDLLLWIRKLDGFDIEKDRALLNWMLQSRYVSVEQRNIVLPFSDFERWLDQHESEILAEYNEAYVRSVIGIFDADLMTGVNVEGMMRRVRVVLETLLSSDHESALREILNKLVSMRYGGLVSAASVFVADHVHLITDDIAFCEVLANYASRLHKSMEDEDEWGLDWESEARCLLKIVESRAASITDENCVDSLRELVTSWGDNDITAKYATRFMDIWAKGRHAYLGEIISHWSEAIFTDLPEDCLNWLGANIDRLTQEQMDDLLQQLGRVEEEDIDDDETRRYAVLFRNMRKETFKSSFGQTHLSNVMGVITDNNNDLAYLQRILPLLVTVIHIAPQSDMGNMLHSLFSDSTNDPEAYGWLHKLMADNWPKQTSETGLYDAEQIFNDSRQFCLEFADEDTADNCLLSMHKMVQRGVVSFEHVPTLLNAAASLWQSHSTAALHVIMSYEQSLPPNDVAHLMDNMDPDNAEQMSVLSDAWHHSAKFMDEKAVADTGIYVIQRDSEDYLESDQYLDFWIASAQSAASDINEVIELMLLDERLSDSHRKRLWLQVETIVSDLRPAFFVNILPDLILSNSKELLDEIFASEQIVSSIFETTLDKNLLGQCLLRAFVGTKSLRVKNKLATWMKNLKAGVLLRNLNKYENVSVDDIRILLKHFPESKSLRRLKAETEQRS